MRDLRPKITILGSCRQDSLASNFIVSCIRDRLTYPHYTKEIIQAIRYCKGELSDGSLPLFAFREGLLHNKKPIKNLLTQEYFDSSLFAIEIASLKQYYFHGSWLHHLAAEPGYGFYGIEDIIKTTQQINEVESDILTIKGLLAPKPFFIISHIYTRKVGQRYELAKLLRQICSSHSIPFFDPVAWFNLVGGIDLFLVDEQVIGHYTSEGHRMCGYFYSLFIYKYFGLTSASFLRRKSSRMFTCLKANLYKCRDSIN